MKPPFINMQTAKHSRESAVKGDDQIAFENGTSFEEACSYQKALDWYAEVKPTGGLWDMSASAGRVAILVALGRATEAVEIGQQALKRMQKPNPELLGETARALNEAGSPREALQLCRRWVRHPANCQQPALWHSGAVYAALYGQFERSLRYLIGYLHFCGGKLTADILLDRDLAQLWHHLENEVLSPLEVRALQHEVWKTNREAIRQKRGGLSFESYAHVPPSLRSILQVHTRSMNWVPHRHTKLAQRTGFDAWCQAVRDSSLASLDAGLRKALAMQPATSGECA
jgi:hypothetical protein